MMISVFQGNTLLAWPKKRGLIVCSLVVFNLQHAKVTLLLAKYTGKLFSQSEYSLTPIIPAQYFSITTDTDMERAVMCETAATAMDEVIRLLQTDEPLWVKSPSDGRYVIERDSYEKAFPKPIHFRSCSARIESSKDSALVTMNAMQLVDMLLDAVIINQIRNDKRR